MSGQADILNAVADFKKSVELARYHGFPDCRGEDVLRHIQDLQEREAQASRWSKAWKRMARKWRGVVQNYREERIYKVQQQRIDALEAEARQAECEYKNLRADCDAAIQQLQATDYGKVASEGPAFLSQAVEGLVRDYQVALQERDQSERELAKFQEVAQQENTLLDSWMATAGEEQRRADKAEQQVETLRGMLKDSNGLLRSALAIANRDGRETNWRAFAGQLDQALSKQRDVLVALVKE